MRAADAAGHANAQEDREAPAEGNVCVSSLDHFTRHILAE